MTALQIVERIRHIIHLTKDCDYRGECIHSDQDIQDEIYKLALELHDPKSGGVK